MLQPLPKCKRVKDFNSGRKTVTSLEKMKIKSLWKKLSKCEILAGKLERSEYKCL